MAADLLDRLARRLSRAETQRPGPCNYVVGLSGGVDSITLLAALSRLRPPERLRCVHVDHRLHPDSGRWAAFCAAAAGRAGIAFLGVRLARAIPAGASLEAAARTARYAALAAELRTGEVLLTAHHAEDQLETLLYRLVRGTGVDGLRGIRECAPFGAGWLLRPWLQDTRAQIRSQALAWGLDWLDDPANEDPRFDRNFLRRNVVPVLLERWPAAATAAGRLAAAAGDAAAIAHDQALTDLAGAAELDRLPLTVLAGLSPPRRRNALRAAIAGLGLPMPDAAALARILGLLEAEPVARHAAWPGGEAHRWAAALYLRPARPPLPMQLGTLVPGARCAVGEGCLELAAAAAPGLSDACVRAGLHMRFRRGGERFQPADKATAMRLGEWLRLRRVLPWMRDRIPLIYCADTLVAVADIALGAAALGSSGSEVCWRIHWHGRPRIGAADGPRP